MAENNAQKRPNGKIFVLTKEQSIISKMTEY